MRFVSIASIRREAGRGCGSAVLIQRRSVEGERTRSQKLSLDIIPGHKTFLVRDTTLHFRVFDVDGKWRRQFYLIPPSIFCL